MRWSSLFLILVLCSATVSADSGRKKIALIISTRDSIIVAQALKQLRNQPNISKRYSLHFYTDREIKHNRVKAVDVRDAAIILADFMKRELDGFLSDALEGTKPKIYGLRCSGLAEKMKEQGLSPDASIEQYYSPATVENVINLVRMVLSEAGENLSFGPPFILPESGIFHPETDRIFNRFEEYFKWYSGRTGFNENGMWVGIHTFSSSALKDNGKIEAHLIQALEKERINVLPIFGRPPYYKSLKKYFLDDRSRPRVQAVCGFGFRFLRGFPQETEKILTRINAPVFIPLTAHERTIDQWKGSAQGISPLRVAWQVCVPEQNGAIEPVMVGGKSAVSIKGMTDVVFDTIPLPEYIDFLIQRIKAWQRLQKKSNPEKRVAILYWNHPPGKQNIGGSYMNCFRSVSNILQSLKHAGYRVDGPLPDEEEIRERILLSGRNVGSWAAGELENLIASGGVVRVPMQRYKEWFSTLPPDFQAEVTAQWGQPEASPVMIKAQHIIIPLVDLGNIILAPQPTRGFGEDPEALYHDPKVYPHHQYIAFYFWLKQAFQVDAIISLGKHGTHEWLPGKQIGLSLSCPPEVLIQDIPNVYPYIVDNVGEGIQAKRRGRGVIIDHLIPPLKKGGAYMEYRKLTGLIDAYHNARNTDALLAEEKLKSVRRLILELGLDRDLALGELNDAAVEQVEHYILEMQETLIPYGLHTFGISPRGDPLTDLTEAICDASPEIKKEDLQSRISECGKNEMTALMKALKGGYIPPAEGNDPVRNPEAVPTGRNFYGFNVDKVPSKEAFVLGEKMARDMIQNYMKRHGTYPDKMGIILWSTELQRNEGASVAAILSLLGIRPVWDRKDQVVDIEPIPGQILGRPRIDVLIQTSGLFRDSYAKLIKILDSAVRLAGSLKDVENFVAINNRKIEQALLEKGYGKDEARDLSQARVFGPMPGAYSHALQELIPNSGIWEEEAEIADVFMHHYSFAYGEHDWGKPFKSGYKRNLEDVKITMHSRSSNLYNMLDNDDMFAFLGGLSLAVKSQAGKSPDVLVANLQDGKGVKLEDLSKAIGKALRTRYLNPEWIKGMKGEGYSGARAMDEFVENLWGFQVTTPFAVDENQWEQIYEVYIEDKYDQDLKAFFDQNNPWAQQSISARMLEAVRKEYWDAPEHMKKGLARNYALNVIEKGVACCEHTCNNPMFRKFVANIISLPGLLTPEQMEQFRMVIAKATGRTRKNDEARYKRNREQLTQTVEVIRKDEGVKADTEGKKLKGFEMVEEKPEDTKITASGSEWMVMAIVVGLLALVGVGWMHKRV